MAPISFAMTSARSAGNRVSKKIVETLFAAANLAIA